MYTLPTLIICTQCTMYLYADRWWTSSSSGGSCISLSEQRQKRPFLHRDCSCYQQRGKRPHAVVPTSIQGCGSLLEYIQCHSVLGNEVTYIVLDTNFHMNKHRMCIVLTYAGTRTSRWRSLPACST